MFYKRRTAPSSQQKCFSLNFCQISVVIVGSENTLLLRLEWIRNTQSKVSKENLLLVQDFSIVFKCGPDIDHMWAGEGFVGINLCQSKFSLEDRGESTVIFQTPQRQTQPSLPCVNTIESFMYLRQI